MQGEPKCLQQQPVQGGRRFSSTTWGQNGDFPPRWCHHRGGKWAKCTKRGACAAKNALGNSRLRRRRIWCILAAQWEDSWHIRQCERRISRRSRKRLELYYLFRNFVGGVGFSRRRFGAGPLRVFLDISACKSAQMRRLRSQEVPRAFLAAQAPRLVHFAHFPPRWWHHRGGKSPF